MLKRILISIFLSTICLSALADAPRSVTIVIDNQTDLPAHLRQLPTSTDSISDLKEVVPAHSKHTAGTFLIDQQGIHNFLTSITLGDAKVRDCMNTSILVYAYKYFDQLNNEMNWGGDGTDLIIDGHYYFVGTSPLKAKADILEYTITQW